MSSRKIIKQDYKLVNAKYKLTSNEIKIIMNAISEIKMEDKEFHRYRIKLSDICLELQNDSLSNKHSRLKNFCENLLKKPLYIPKKKGFLVVNWFSSLEYIQGSSEIEYEISSKLKPYLLDLKKRFIKYNLKYILPLSSIYSIRIYQLIKEYEKAKKREFDLEYLQDILQVPKSYINYADFKRKVLQVAEKEIVKNCDIFFEYEEIKNGRKVEKILFRIKKNPIVTDFSQNSLFPDKPTELENKLSKYINKTVSTSKGTKTIIKIDEYFTDNNDNSAPYRFGFEISFLDGSITKCNFFSELDCMTGYSKDCIHIDTVRKILNQQKRGKKLNSNQRRILDKYMDGTL